MRKIFVLCVILSAFLIGNPAHSTRLTAQGTPTYQYAYVVQQPGQFPDLILVDPVSASVVTVTIPTRIEVVEALLSPNGEWLALLPLSDLINETIILYNLSSG